jgi:hypothetical protein
MRVLASIVFATSLLGCVADEGDESFVIVANLVPDEAEGNILSFTPRAEGPFFSRVVAPFEQQSVTVGSLLESRIVAPEGRESLRTIQVQGANITLEISPVFIEKDSLVEERGETEIEQFQILFSAAIPPNGGLAVGIYDLIPTLTMARIRAKAGDAFDDINGATLVEILTTTTVFGDYYGDALESTPYQFPVSISQPLRCGDFVCDPFFEDVTSCPFDCRCGNGTCEIQLGETDETCPVDCPPPPP